MSILIKGMKKPRSCDFCPISLPHVEELGCGFDLEHCSITEVPRHGRLIDANEISEHKYATLPPYRKEYADGKPKSEDEVIAFKFGWNNAIDAITENAPTIIPAEEVE